jgi:flagellar biosynthetic protein FliQ
VDTDTVVQLGQNAMQLSLQVALPMLVAGLGVGLVVSIFQAVTQIQEQTLTFIPKVLALAAVLVILGPWMLNQVLSYTTDLWSSIPNMVG